MKIFIVLIAIKHSFCDDQEEDIANIAKTVLIDMMDILNNAVQFNDTTSINIPTVCDIMINHNGTEVYIISSRTEFLQREYFVWKIGTFCSSKLSHKSDDCILNHSKIMIMTNSQTVSFY